MTRNTQNQQDSEQSPDNSISKRQKKPYTTPLFEAYGKIRNLTLGGSSGLGDTGDPLATQP